MRAIFAVGLLTLASLHAAPPVQLFNGKDLSGWTYEFIDYKTTADSVWSVKDGILVCGGRPPGVMRSTGVHENYELLVEWRWAPGGKPGNSGVLVHASTPRETFVWPRSIEVQLRTGNVGDFWMNGESLKVPGVMPDGRRWVKKADAEKPPGEWNALRIRCQGDQLSVHLNGVLVNEATSLSTTKGAICLQSENSEIHFRKVELTPIP